MQTHENTTIALGYALPTLSCRRTNSDNGCPKGFPHEESALVEDQHRLKIGMHYINFKVLILWSLMHFFFNSKSLAQVNFINPSFEGVGGFGVTLYGWDSCSIDEIYVLPFTPISGIHFKSAYDKNTYIWLFGNNKNINEIPITTQLPCSLKNGKKTVFYCYLYTLLDDHTNPSTPGVLKIYGGNSKCSTQELLWTSPVLDTFWRQYKVEFTPSQNYKYLTFYAKPGMFSTSDLASNVFVDNLSPIYIENLSEITASASASDIKAGEAVQLQSIINSNLIQPPYSITWHSSLNNFNSAEQNPGVVMPVITTTYYVELKDSCGYKAWDSVVVHVNSGGKVYYDFANQKIKVVFGSDGATENYQLTLYNTLGQRIATETLPLNIHEYEYSTAGLPKAMYYVSVRSGSGKVFGGKVLIAQ